MKEKLKIKNIFSKKNIIKITVAVIALVLFIGAVYMANRGKNGYTITDTTGTEYETARVLKIIEDNSEIDETSEGIRRGSMELQLEILTGRYKSDIVEVTNYFSSLYNVDVDEGDTVSVRIDTTDVNEYSVSIYNYNRTPALIIFVLIFALALILIGGLQGLRAFAGLVFTFVSIIFLFVPLAMKGWPVVPAAVVLVGMTSTVCFYLLGGWQPKTIAAALGCLCGVCFAALFGYIGSSIVHVTAYQTDEAEALMLVMDDSDLKMKGLLLASVLIAAEGAVMDIAMSVASAMNELREKNPLITAKELFVSGMRVGRDASGTMANTLVLAYAGSSLNMIVLIYSYDVSFTQLMNTDFVAVELIKGIAGSLGIIMTIPCVALICSALLTKNKKEKPEIENRQ